jgi:GT2 family glycosyltransferase
LNSPSVHIVILNWNGLDDTLECLASLEKLSYPNVKAIVVDNASRDKQAETIEQKYPDVVVLKQTENLGFCGGCNVGIKHALESGADFVMLLNNDTLVPPDLLEKLFTGFENLENVGAVSPIILEYPATEKIWFSKARWDGAEAQFRLSKQGEKYEDFSAQKPYLSDFACGCCLLAPAEIFEKIGLFDERYFAFYDEAEWCARLKEKGFESYVIPSAFMYHKVSRSTPSLVSTYLLSRNRLLWMTENLPFKAKLKALPYLLKEFVWHSLNLIGLRKGKYTKQHSRTVLKGWKDYMLGKFYKWDAKTEKIIFSAVSNENSSN